MPTAVNPLYVIALFSLAIAIVILNDIGRLQLVQKWAAEKHVHLPIKSHICSSLWLGAYLLITVVLIAVLEPRIGSRRLSALLAASIAAILLWSARKIWRIKARN